MNKITWSDIGMATEPGQCQTRLGLVDVTAADIEVWQQFPQATFAIFGQSLHDSPDTVLHLGAFDIALPPRR
jgi:hypothetical protein